MRTHFWGPPFRPLHHLSQARWGLDKMSPGPGSATRRKPLCAPSPHGIGLSVAALGVPIHHHRGCVPSHVPARGTSLTHGS